MEKGSHLRAVGLDQRSTSYRNLASTLRDFRCPRALRNHITHSFGSFDTMQPIDRRSAAELRIREMSKVTYQVKRRRKPHVIL